MSFTNIISTLASFIKDSVEEPDGHHHKDLSPSEQVVFYSITGIVVIGCLACCFYKRRASRSRAVSSYGRTNLMRDQDDVEAATQLSTPRAK